MASMQAGMRAARMPPSRAPSLPLRSAARAGRPPQRRARAIEGPGIRNGLISANESLAAVEADLEQALAVCKYEAEVGLARAEGQLAELRAATRADAGSALAQLDDHGEVHASLAKLQARATALRARAVTAGKGSAVLAHQELAAEQAIKEQAPEEDRKQAEGAQAELQRLEEVAQVKEEEHTVAVWSGRKYTIGWTILQYEDQHGSIHFSPIFTVDGLQWKFLLLPQKGKGHIALYLIMVGARTKEGRGVQSAFTLVNQQDPARSYTIGTTADVFGEASHAWGDDTFFKREELEKAGAGWLVDNKLKVRATIKRLD